MADKISAVMATEMALDVAPAQRSLQSLRQSVNIVNNAIRAQTSDLEASGKAMQAAQGHAEGLNDVINRQREYVAALETKQKELYEVAKNHDQIIKETTSNIKSLSAQREKVGSELGRQSTEYKQLTEQIKQYQAQQRQANTVDRSLSSVTNKLENARTRLARYNSEQKSVNSSIKNMKIEPWRKLGSAIHGTVDTLNTTREKINGFRGVLMGTFAGNVLSNAASTAWSGVKTAIGGAVVAGTKFNQQQQTMLASWKTLTGSAQEGQKLVDMTNELAVSAQNSTEMVNNLNQRFYAVTNNADKTRQLSKAVLTLQDAFGASDEAIDNFSTQWSQMVGNGKASAQDMLSIQNVFPKFRQELLKYEQDVTHNKNLTMQQMNDMMSQGKITSDAMNTVLLNMGKEYQNATENYAKTLPGMARTIKAMMPRLLGQMTEPLTKAESPVYKAVSKWVSDPKTSQKFTQLGKTVQKQMNNVMKAFSNGAKPADIQKILNNAISTIEKAITKLGSWLASHANAIKATFSLIGNAARAAFALAAQVIRTAVSMLASFTGQNRKASSGAKSTAQQIRGLSNWFKKLANNKGRLKTFARILVTLFAIGKIVKFVSWIMRVVTVLKQVALAIRAVTMAMASNPLGLLLVAISLIISRLAYLYTTNKKFRNWVNSLGSAIKNGFLSAIDWIVDKWKSFTKWIHDSIKSIGDWFKNIGKGFKDFMNFGVQDQSKVAGYASGTSGTTSDQLALVNDANSQNWREMMEYNGQLYALPNKRNVLMPIPAGASIINGDVAADFAKKNGIKQFASGTSQLNSLIANVNENGANLHASERSAFISELRTAYSEQMSEVTKAIKEANDNYRKAEQESQKTFRNAINEAKKSMTEAVQQARQEQSESQKDARQTLTDAIKDANGDQTKINSANSTYRNSMTKAFEASRSASLKARQSYSTAMSKAKQSRKQSGYNARVNRDNALNNAKNNQNKINYWYNANVSNFDKMAATFANGGIADRPSIFGEAGPEAAIPLNAMQEGNAWQLLQKVVNFYAGGDSGVNSGSNGDEGGDGLSAAAVGKKLDRVAELLTVLINGQANQTQSIKGINGYDKQTALADVSAGIASAVRGGLIN